MGMFMLNWGKSAPVSLVNAPVTIVIHPSLRVTGSQFGLMVERKEVKPFHLYSAGKKKQEAALE